MSELLAWVDVETTGLDPTEGLLLQVACILTDLAGNIISEPYEAVIHQDRDEVEVAVGEDGSPLMDGRKPRFHITDVLRLADAAGLTAVQR